MHPWLYDYCVAAVGFAVGLAATWRRDRAASDWWAVLLLAAVWPVAFVAGLVAVARDAWEGD